MSHKNFFGYFQKFTRDILFASIVKILATVLQLVTVSKLSNLIDFIKDEHDTSKITQSAVLIFVLELLCIAFNRFADKKINYSKITVASELNSDLSRQISRAKQETVNGFDSTWLSERCNEGTSFTNAIHTIYNNLFSIAMGIFSLIRIAFKSWILAGLFVVFLIILSIIQRKMIAKLTELRLESRKAADSRKLLITEAILAFIAVKSQNLLKGLGPIFDKRLSSEYEANLKSANIDVTNNSISSFIRSLYQFLFLILGGYLITKNFLSFGDFVEIFILRGKVDQIAMSLIVISGSRVELASTKIRMNDIFNDELLPKEIYGNVREIPSTYDIHIKNLSSSYDGKKVLDNISLDIPSGKLVGLVGSSGCGKTSLLNILSNQKIADSGEIYIGENLISDYSLSTLSKVISLAPQTAYLFSMSIAENLRLARPNATEEDLIRALKTTSSYEFVMKLGGLNTIVSSKQLSGGQLQRLALSRLYLVSSRIILLDESTSALDSKTQKEIMNVISRATKFGHTVIMVAHRLSTLKHADLIVHLENGHIIETGTYDELIESSESFRALASE